MQVARLLNELDPFFTQETLNDETLRVHRGRLEGLQHQLTEMYNAVGILISEGDVEEEFTRLGYDSWLTTSTAKSKHREQQYCAYLNGASTAASRSELEDRAGKTSNRC